MNNRIILLFVLVMLFFKIVDVAWSQEHTPMITQLRMKNIQASESDPLKLLLSQRFDVLDNRLNTLQAEYELDTEREFAVSAAFKWFDIADPRLESLFQEWLKAYPESYAANLALGIYYMAMAVEWRGSKYYNETHQKRIENMESYLEKAVIYFEKSLYMAEKPFISYGKLIAVARFHGDDKASEYWLSEALKKDPFCVRPRNFYMRTLEPRWGGSYNKMRVFAETTRKGTHPKLTKAALYYEGWIHWYKGFESYLKDNYVAALNEYKKAIETYDDSRFRLSRAKIYQIVGQSDLAMADINRALDLDPQSTKGLYMRGIALLEKRQTDEALNDLHLAAEYGHMDAIKKLGNLYNNGDLGIPLNVEEGMKLWKNAAYFWDVDAAFALAGAYAQGLGVNVDNTAAVKYLRISAEQGHGLAINNLGLMLWHGRGTLVNREEAVQLWVMGAKKDIWQSKHNLKFFLSPSARFKLALTYPQILLEDKQIMVMGIASMLAVILMIIILVKISMRKDKRQRGS